MPINKDKTHLWKRDVEASVDLFNSWFMLSAPKAYRDTRVATTGQVEEAIRLTSDLTAITPAVLRQLPQVLPALRMSTCPPIARDRLVGLAGVGKDLVKVMEEGKIPQRISERELEDALQKIAEIIAKLLDIDMFPWILSQTTPSDVERYRASTIVADRLCGAVSDPIVRNAQERRQLAMIAEYLNARGYQQKSPPSGSQLRDMEPGTYGFRLNVVVGDTKKTNIPIDVVIQPKTPRSSGLPILIEAKSAGDFANTNKRRKEEAQKITQLHQTYGDKVDFIRFLCGHFGGDYLGYEAMHGIDWIWEHRIEDMDQLGI